MTEAKRMSELRNVGVVLKSELSWAEIKLRDMETHSGKPSDQNRGQNGHIGE